MALYFAELDSDNNVIRVITTPEDIVSSPNDPAGETWCSNNISDDPDIPLVDGAYPGVAWKQTYKTAFDAATRWNYAATGGTYDPVNDAFIHGKQFDSYVLNDKFKYVAPVAFPTVDDRGNNLPRDAFHPDNLAINWDEPTLSWVGQRWENNVLVSKVWNPNTSTWSIKE
tara:strand:- start:7836 stop:8345 length:510 start_codon:yes stop_codon:yes gene_type:complete